MSNPLQKYFRQPKIYISLPSKGLYYKPGDLIGDHSNVPIFGMTGMDEIIMKTPDALFNGEATIKVIESCCPYIKDAKSIPSLDIDVLLAAIRIATSGEKMIVNHTCPKCSTDNEYDINLSSVIDFYSSRTFNNRLQIDDLLINLRPLNYQDMTRVNIENFKLQRIIMQINEKEVEEKQEILDQLYSKLADIQVELFLLSIESIRTPEALVTDRDQILEWLKNSPRETYHVIKSHLEKSKDEWSVPKQSVKCGNCGHEDEVSVILDQSNFFD